MKNLILMLVIVTSAMAMSACSKDKGNNGNYATTPGANCASGTYPGMNYQQGYNPRYIQNGVYGNQNVNCIPQNYINSGNPYFFQGGYNYQAFLGTCDLSFSGRGQLCPVGYQCRPAFGAMGICMRVY
jgi:hypothetical protein